MTTTMRAMRIHSWGGPKSLTYDEVPLPRLAPDDLLVAVHAAAVNPVDWKIREGQLKELVQHELPLIPGWDFSGEVVNVGPNVTRFAPGDEVFGRSDIARDGSYAEYIAVRQSEVAHKPHSIDHVQAASVPLAALTAWQALVAPPKPAGAASPEEPAEEQRGASLESGDRVLIHGAAGGVGSFAVQLALWRGAHVIGTGSRHNEAFLRELGVHQFVDYEEQRFETVTGPVDVVLDTIGGETQQRSWQVLAPGGKLVSTVSVPPQEEARARSARASFIFVQPDSEQLSAISRLIDTGVLRPIVSEVMPLSDARRAQARSQLGHTRGKIVLTVRN